MARWFVDTNVLLDYLANRPGFVEAAEQLFLAAADGKVRLCTSGLSFATVYYLLRRQGVGHAATLILLREVNRLLVVQPLTETTVQAALGSNFTDFEDALQYFVATSDAQITAIITRDPSGFRAGTLPVLSPGEAVKRLTTD